MVLEVHLNGEKELVMTRLRRKICSCEEQQFGKVSGEDTKSAKWRNNKEASMAEYMEEAVRCG